MKPLRLKDAVLYPQREPVGQDSLWLLHGAGGNHQHFLGLARYLKDHANCVPVDLPAHGRHTGAPPADLWGYAQAILEAMDEAGAERVVLAGHSMGGGVALCAALLAPHRVAGLVLLATGAKLGVTPHLLSLLKTDFEAFLKTGLTVAFAPGAPDHLVAAAQRAMAQTGAELLAHDFELCNAFDVRHRLEEITCPALVLCGQNDHMTPPKWSEFLLKNMPGAEGEILPGPGHMLMLETPAAVAQKTAAFLASLPSYR